MLFIYAGPQYAEIAMMTSNAYPSRWTERELVSDIARLDELIVRMTRCDDRRSRCAASYLRQVAKDRRDALSTLRYHRVH